MARIAQLPYERASVEAKAAHEEELRLRGRMTNMKRTLLHSPAALRVYGEWFTLRDELRPVLGDRTIWLFAHAISQASQSRIGIGFMRRALIQGGDDPDGLVPSAGEALLQRFGKAIVETPKAIPDDIWRELAGTYSDKTLVDLVAFAGIMVATNVFTDVVEVAVDDELAEYLGSAD